MAATQQNNVDELFRSVERSQEQYLKSLRALHDTMHGTLSFTEPITFSDPGLIIFYWGSYMLAKGPEAIGTQKVHEDRPGPDPLNADNGFSTYEVYDIKTDGLAITRHDDKGSAEDEVLDADVVWGTIKDVNTDNATVGRITIFQEASPAMLAGIHLVMREHFDMDELFHHLVSPHGKTTAHMHRATEPKSIHQRSFYFVFKYYTVVGEGLTPAPWQQYDHRPPDTKSPDHIDITECSSILALSLEGDPVKEYQFMFDPKLRDKLLFEDADFTFSRRYFWAYNSLGVVNDGMKSMISAYTDTFTPDFWAGTHQTLWPHPVPDSPEGRHYLDQMGVLRQELEHAVEDLKAVLQANEQVRQEIVSLREQLFSGSSVKESRRAIEQGDNIKILTGVSMLFLPLTFVTSVFGITQFTFTANDWRFPVTMVAVCVPFFLLIFILQTRAGMRAIKKLGDLIERNMGRWNDHSRNRHERRLQLQQQLVQAAESQEQQQQAAAAASSAVGRRRMSLRRGGRKTRQGGAGGGKPGHGNGAAIESMRVIDGVSVEQADKWWGWRRKKGEDMLEKPTGNSMESAQSSSTEEDYSSVWASDSDSGPEPQHAEAQPKPRKQRYHSRGLFTKACIKSSLPLFIEALEAARNPACNYTEDEEYQNCIWSGLHSSIQLGRTHLAAYLLNNDPVAPTVLRGRIDPYTVALNATVPLLELLVVRHGWDVNAQGGGRRDRMPLVSLVIAQPNEHELVCWLVDHGARLDFGEGEEEGEEEEEDGDDGYARSSRRGARPPALLETCGRSGSVELFRMLRARGARLGRRTLHLACSTAAMCGADPGVSSQDRGRDRLGREGRTGEQGTEDDDSDTDGHDPEKILDRGAMVRYLVEEVGLDVNQTDTDIIGMDGHFGVPLLYAAQWEKGAAVVRWLLGKGADPLFTRRTITADVLARDSPEVQQVLEEWKEVNPERVQQWDPSARKFFPPLEWHHERTWQEWEAYEKELGSST
ncbi:hypothetical protein VMCG_06145 [Cytospora schulzeri]|uniref:Uncharacterized protein n=1 Tax=Cytospora schulzeri TaxID=448051 RepID=A0A423WGH2_9PEZI|nr:hypothetical protein VMCG_06145 [Valsa malicola]